MGPQRYGHDPELLDLCDMARKLIEAQRYAECRVQVCTAMKNYPHSPIPHNLMGIALEKEGCHAVAMRHFRAACALDPNYLPSRHNLDHFGTFFSMGGCAYSETDCEEKRREIDLDIHGIGHTPRRNENEAFWNQE